MTQFDPDCAPIAVAIAILASSSDRLSVVLVEAEPGTWVLPEGVRQGDEGLDVAVARVLDEQAAIDLPDQVTQLWTYEDPTPTLPRGGVTVAFRAATYYPLALSLEPERTAAGPWSVDQVLRGELGTPAAHQRIVRDAIDRARADAEVTDLALSFVDTRFTLTELREVFDAIWETTHDPANFRRAMLAADPPLLETTRQRGHPESKGGRPPELYRPVPQSWLDGPPLHRPRSAKRREASQKLFRKIRAFRRSGRSSEALDLCPLHWTTERSAILAEIERSTA